MKKALHIASSVAGSWIIASVFIVACDEAGNFKDSSVLPPVEDPTWSYIGLETERISVIRPSEDNPDELLVGSMSNFNEGTVGGVFHTVDKGSHWDTLFYGGSITDIEIDPNDDQRVFIASTINGVNTPGIFRSDNFGATWDTLTLPSGVVDWTGPSNLSINPENSNDLLVGISGVSGGGLYRSFDGGYHWQSVVEPTIALAGVSTIARHPTSPGTIFVGTPDIGALFRSTDFGESWQQLDLPELWIVYDIEFFTPCPDTILVGTYEAGIWVTHDGGESWMQFNGGLSSVSTVPSIETTIDGGVFAAVDEPGKLAKVYGTNIAQATWGHVGDFVATTVTAVAVGVDWAVYAGSYWMMVYD